MLEPPVEITAPDISRYRGGTNGVPYVIERTSGRPGPHVVITALVHGNELCGAWALARLLERGIEPNRGRLSLVFVNIAAYERFDPERPRLSRFVDEDLNRVWDPATLDGDRTSVELTRAREIRSLIVSADYLLDLHSMQLPAAPLLLAGTTPKGRALAAAMAYPGLVVVDAGHRAGARMRDHGRFNDPDQPQAAMLIECGQHWARTSVEVAHIACRRFLQAVDVVDHHALDAIAPEPPPQPQRVVEITDAVTVGEGPFHFAEDFQGLEVIPEAGTVIAHDGERPIRTPYRDCVLVMPSRRLAPGLTAVRLGRFVR